MNSIYNGMSGLLAFSKGLNTISSNVSNMNTPGYKSSEMQFLDVFYRSQYTASQDGDVSFSQTGNGVGTGSTTTRFSPGEIRSTGQELDVAIDGNGFLILRKDNEQLYSRAGQLSFDQDGYLITRSGQARVLAIDENGNLSEISQVDFLTMDQSPTTEIRFTGILSTGTQNNNGDPIHELSDITAIDSLGEEKSLRLEFELTNITTLEWTVRVYEDSNLITTDTIRYQPSGQPQDSENQISFDLTAGNGETTSITINMGNPGDTDASSSSSFGTTSTLNVLEADGFSSGSMVSTSINSTGVLVSQYSNGETLEHAQLAMASFLQLQELDQRSAGLFAANGVEPVVGRADDGVMGRFIPRSVELSNVELTQQFGDLIIVQRGYQASSQILTVSNEMLQQLIEMRGRG